MEAINLRFLCPDEEFRSKICQLVYEELLAVFEFNEELVKLHSFIKTASWSYPIATMTFEAINIVNTICSIASFYDVGLEVIRTDAANPLVVDPNYSANVAIHSNMILDEQPVRKNKKGKKSKENTDVDPDVPAILETIQPQGFSMKYKVSDAENDAKNNGVKSALSIIERCAENGAWVLISTPEFPSFWPKMCNLLDKMRKERHRIKNSFRIFVDLQAYDLKTVSTSFLSEHSLRFVLTEANNEDMEGFNDIWANILNGDIINNSDNISEHPSLQMNNPNLDIKQNDTSASQHMLGDISAITHEGVKNDPVRVKNEEDAETLKVR